MEQVRHKTQTWAKELGDWDHAELESNGGVWQQCPWAPFSAGGAPLTGSTLGPKNRQEEPYIRCVFSGDDEPKGTRVSAKLPHGPEDLVKRMGARHFPLA